MRLWNARRAVAGATLGVALAVSGCDAAGSPSVDASQVPGVWTGDGGGMVEFMADGRFTMTGVPRDAVVFSFSEPPPGDGGLSGAGKWVIDPADDAVELSIEAGGSFRDGEIASLKVAEGEGPQVLYFETNSEKAYGYEIRKKR